MEGNVERVIASDNSLALVAYRNAHRGILPGLMLSRARVIYFVAVQTYDPLTYISMTALVTTITLLACYISTHRVAPINPSPAVARGRSARAEAGTHTCC